MEHLTPTRGFLSPRGTASPWRSTPCSVTGLGRRGAPPGAEAGRPGWGYGASRRKTQGRGSKPPVIPEDGFIGGGYGVPTVASREAQAFFGRNAGVVLDPVYTAKAGANAPGGSDLACRRIHERFSLK